MPLQETHISKSKLQAIVQSIMDDEKKKAVALEHVLMKIYFLSKQQKTKEKYNVFSDHEEQYACIWVLLKSVL